MCRPPMLAWRHIATLIVASRGNLGKNGRPRSGAGLRSISLARRAKPWDDASEQVEDRSRRPKAGRRKTGAVGKHRRFCWPNLANASGGQPWEIAPEDDVRDRNALP